MSDASSTDVNNHTEINHWQHMLHFDPPACNIEWSSLSLVNLPTIKTIARFVPASTYWDWDQNYAACIRALRCIRGRLKVRIQLSSCLPGEAAIAWRSKSIHFLTNNEREINTTSFIHLLILLHSIEGVQAAMTTGNLEPDKWRNREEWRSVSGRWRQLL